VWKARRRTGEPCGQTPKAQNCRRVGIAVDNFGCWTWHHPGRKHHWWLSSRPCHSKVALKKAELPSFLPDRHTVAPAIAETMVTGIATVWPSCNHAMSLTSDERDVENKDVESGSTRVMQSGLRQVLGEHRKRQIEFACYVNGAAHQGKNGNALGIPSRGCC
jgi:hypothetical protein